MLFLQGPYSSGEKHIATSDSLEETSDSQECGPGSKSGLLLEVTSRILSKALFHEQGLRNIPIPIVRNATFLIPRG